MSHNRNHNAQINITTQHSEAFNALTSGDFVNFALVSCFVDGAPAAAIVAVNVDGESYDMHPLFVSVTEKMVLTDHEGRTPAFLDDPTPSTSAAKE